MPSACCTGRSEKLNSTQSVAPASRRSSAQEGTTNRSLASKAKRQAADLRHAAAFHHRIDAGVGAARGLPEEAGRQQLQAGGDGRHGPAAGGRVDVAQLVAFPGIGPFEARQALEDLAAARVGVAEQRRGRRRRLVAQRQHVAAVAGEAVAFATSQRLHRFAVALGEGGAEETQHRDVQAVQPDHRLAAFRGGAVAVVVPGPGRSDDEVARLHAGAFAVHRGVGAVALDDEAQGRLGVPVAGSDLARQDQLQAGVEARGDRRLAGKVRVLQHQHAAHRFLGADQIACLEQERAQFAIAPQRRLAAAGGLRRDQAVQGFPERGEVLLADASIEVGALLGGIVVMHTDESPAGGGGAASVW